MQNGKIDILLIEDNLFEADLIKEILSKARQLEFSVQHVQRLSQGVGLLQERGFDVVLVDLELPGSQGLESALTVRRESRRTPVVVLTVLDDEETALKSLQMDIQDYLVKGEITAPLLVRSIRYAMQRKRDSESLRESENRYRTLIEAIDEGFCIVEVLFDQNEKPVDCRFLETNPSFARQTGLVDFLGKGMRELVPELEEYWFETYGKIAVTGEPVRFQYSAGPLHRWFDSYAFRFGEASLRQVAILFSDITERKLAEDALRESEELRRVFIDSAPAALAMFDREMRYIYASRRWFIDHGLPEKDLRGISYYEFFLAPPESWKEAHRRGLAGEILKTEAELFERADGAKQWVRWEILPWYNKAGEVGGIVIFTEDITESRKRSEHIRTLSKAVERSPVTVIITDARGIIEYANPKFAEITGYTLEEAVGRNPRILKSGKTPPEVFRDLWGTIRAGGEWQGEFLNQKRNGEYYWEAASISPIFDDEGKISHFVAVKEDITERKKSEEEIKQLNAALAARAAELETSNQDLEAFNYTVAHDLRQPLNVIGTFSQAIDMMCGNQLSRQCSDYVQGTYKAVLRMNGLIEALLNFSRQAHAELHREPLDLSALAHEVAEQLMLGEPGRRVVFRITDGIDAYGDVNLLRVVMDNLLGNAWKHSGPRDEAVIEFDVTDMDGKPVYLVRDNGPGFDMKDAGLLFAPFKRLPGAAENSGFGIGLATVQRIVQRHGGRIWAEGKSGHGACFYFTLEFQPQSNMR